VRCLLASAAFNKPMTENHITVLGLGNILNMDEGIGVHAIWEMQKRQRESNRYPGIELVDGGALGMRLLSYVDEATHLILLDLADAGKEPGELVELAGDDIPLYTGIKVSLHQVTFQEVLGVSLARGHLPEHLYLIGMQPISLEIGAEPTPKGKAIIPKMIARAEEILQSWGVWQPPESDTAPKDL